MKQTKYILLVIGLLGVVASVIGWINEQSVTNYLTGFICGACLVFGYFEMDKAEKRTK